MVKLLGDIKVPDKNSHDKMLTLLLSDEVLMQQFNNERRKAGLKVVDFKSVKTINELKEPKWNVSFDQLLEVMSTINLDDNAPIDNTLYGKNYHDDYKNIQHQIIASSEGFNETQGVNALVFDEHHDFLKDL